ncbi:MAG: hypothetical protein AAFX81_00380 [Pseudomonadota bacterium]
MARLRINLQQREFEVEGTEEFVKAYAERFEQLLEGFQLGTKDAPLPAAVAGDAAGEGFGELLQALPRTATDVDRMLLAGWFVQCGVAERTFSTADASRRLVDQGVKVGNPSQSVKQNLVAKRAFQVQRGRYRVAQGGLAHLEALTGGRLKDG